MTTLKIQVLLYEHTPVVIEKFLTSLLLNRPGANPELYDVTLHVGDCSAHPLLEEGAQAHWQAACVQQGWQFQYTFFDRNLGFSKGHNTLYFRSDLPQADRLLILNPDAVVPFHMVDRLNAWADRRTDWGIIEARQIPFEHPKDYDPDTMETGFACGACALYDGASFAECGGYDEIFFMYSEDVDLSWRIRALGRKIYFAIDTFLYHSKQAQDHGLIGSEAELYYSRLSQMIIRVKYNRAELVQPLLDGAREHHSAEYNARLEAEWHILQPRIEPATPAQIAAATFTPEGDSTARRWAYR